MLHVLKTRFLKYFLYYYGHTHLLLTQCLCFYRYCLLIALACHNHSMSKHIMWCVPSTSVLLTSGHYNLLSVFGGSDANSSTFQVAIVIHYFRFPSLNHYWCRKFFLIQEVLLLFDYAWSRTLIWYYYILWIFIHNFLMSLIKNVYYLF